MESEYTATPAAARPAVGAAADAAADAATPGTPAGAAARALTRRELPHMARYVMRPIPERGIVSTEVPPVVSVRSVRDELEAEHPAAVAAAHAVSLGAEQPEAAGASHGLDGIGSEEFECVFLGTGASTPSKYRNVTAIYCDFFTRGGVLLDCGEGTLGQLRRRYGYADTERRLRELRCVWISHIHADHHVGLPAVLAERARLVGPSAEPIPLFGPFPLRPVTSACDRMHPLAYTWFDQYQICPREQGAGRRLDDHWDRAAKLPDAGPTVASICDSLGLASMESVLVDHCKHAFGVVLTSKRGWKFVFSGDTQRCDNLVAAAAGATVLVHEATFENDKQSDALYKKHSTIADALEVGRLAKCHTLVLTHFSQRYPKIPVLSDASQASTGVAFDMMTVNLAHLSAVPRVMPILKELFKEGSEGDDEAAEC